MRQDVRTAAALLLRMLPKHAALPLLLLLPCLLLLCCGCLACRCLCRRSARRAGRYASLATEEEEPLRKAGPPASQHRGKAAQARGRSPRRGDSGAARPITEAEEEAWAEPELAETARTPARSGAASGLALSDRALAAAAQKLAAAHAQQLTETWVTTSSGGPLAQNGSARAKGCDEPLLMDL